VTDLELNLRRAIIDGMQPTLRNHEGRISIYSHIVPDPIGRVRWSSGSVGCTRSSST